MSRIVTRLETSFKQSHSTELPAATTANLRDFERTAPRPADSTVQA